MTLGNVVDLQYCARSQWQQQQQQQHLESTLQLCKLQFTRHVDNYGTIFQKPQNSLKNRNNLTRRTTLSGKL